MFGILPRKHVEIVRPIKLYKIKYCTFKLIVVYALCANWSASLSITCLESSSPRPQLTLIQEFHYLSIKIFIIGRFLLSCLHLLIGGLSLIGKYQYYYYSGFSWHVSFVILNVQTLCVEPPSNQYLKWSIMVLLCLG